MRRERMATTGCFSCFLGRGRRLEDGSPTLPRAAKSTPRPRHKKSSSYLGLTSLLGSSLRSRLEQAGLLEERPSIRSNVTPTPRNVRLEADGDESSLVSDPEDALKLAQKPLKSPLHFRQSKDLFINNTFLSSDNTTELESVRQAFKSTPDLGSSSLEGTESEQASSSGCAPSPDDADADADGDDTNGWSAGRHKLQSGEPPLSPPRPATELPLSADDVSPSAQRGTFEY